MRVSIRNQLEIFQVWENFEIVKLYITLLNFPYKRISIIYMSQLPIFWKKNIRLVVFFNWVYDMICLICQTRTKLIHCHWFWKELCWVYLSMHNVKEKTKLFAASFMYHLRVENDDDRMLKKSLFSILCFFFFNLIIKKYTQYCVASFFNLIIKVIHVRCPFWDILFLE